MGSFLFLAFSLVSQDFANLPEFDHSLDWKTHETEHFLIHYPPSLVEPAARMVEIVEPVHTRLTTKFKWEPSSKVHLVLTDFVDDSNGLATPVPYNAIYLYITPPYEDSSLDSYDDWLKLLFTHEYTHIVHLDQARGFNKVLRAIFGRIILPNGAQQQWAIEGLAELQETVETTKGRGRSPFVEMFLRTVALEDEFIPIEKATYWNPDYPSGNAAYFYGIGFHQFLVNRYGEDKINQLPTVTSSSVIPAFFNFKVKVF